MAIALQDDNKTSRSTTATSTATTATATASRMTGRRTRRLGRRAHRAILTTHILVSVGWFGVAATVAFCALVGSSTDDVAFYEVVGATLWLSVPLGLAAAASGVVLSVTTRWGLARHWWVVIKEAITLAVIVTDVLVVGPAMAEAVDAGAPTEIPGPVFAHCVVLALATALSVIKPRAQTPLA